MPILKKLLSQKDNNIKVLVLRVCHVCSGCVLPVIYMHVRINTHMRMHTHTTHRDFNGDLHVLLASWY